MYNSTTSVALTLTIVLQTLTTSTHRQKWYCIISYLRGVPTRWFFDMFIMSMQHARNLIHSHVFTFHIHYSLFTQIYITFLSISYFFTTYNPLINIEFLLLFEQSSRRLQTTDRQSCKLSLYVKLFLSRVFYDLPRYLSQINFKE